jgi:hypothetical protein
MLRARVDAGDEDKKGLLWLAQRPHHDRWIVHVRPMSMAGAVSANSLSHARAASMHQSVS